MKRWLSVVALSVVCCLPMHAADKKNQLPESIASAKTIYVINQASSMEIGTTAYEELERWGHYKVVHDAKSADIILHFFEINRDSHGDTGTAIAMYVTAGISDDRLFQSQVRLAFTSETFARKNVVNFENWVEGK